MQADPEVRAYFRRTISSPKMAARIATPSSRNSGREAAPVICALALGCRATPSAIAAASRPMPMPAPMTVRPNPMPAPMYASAMSISSLLRRSSVSVNSHADEHGCKQGKAARLNQDHDQLERRQGHTDGQRHHQADADAGERVLEELREDEDQRQQREDGDVPADHVSRKSHGERERAREHAEDLDRDQDRIDEG